jgi:hypothetical protein
MLNDPSGGRFPRFDCFRNHPPLTLALP